MRLLSRIIYLLGLMALFAPALAQQPVSSNTPVARVIVKFKDDGNFLRRAASLDRTKSLSTRLGFQILQGHEIATGHQVVTAKGMTSEQLAAHISKLSEVEFAEPDERRKINAITNDPIFPKQWYLQNTQASASNFSAAWELGTGSRQTVVAVLDTGITEHPDLRNKLLPGYNFISDPVLALNGGMIIVSTGTVSWCASSKTLTLEFGASYQANKLSRPGLTSIRRYFTPSLRSRSSR